MATRKIYSAVELGGGGTGYLDSINGSLLNDGDVCITITSAGRRYWHYLDVDSAEEELSPTVISPDSNAGDKRWKLSSAEDLGTKTMIITVFPYPITPTTGDNKVVIPMPLEMNGMELISAHAFQYGVTSSASTINIVRFNVSTLTANDMLSTPITIDAGEFSSYTAAIQPVINTAYDDVIAVLGTAHDHITISVDEVGTGTAGLSVTLGFRLP